MQCLTCRAELVAAARFCTECGAPVPATCVACGHTNHARAHYCAECGAQLETDRQARDGVPRSRSTPPARVNQNDGAERRQLTVLFCDLVGSTALASRLDPEVLRDVLAGYRRCVTETIDRFRGFVARLVGDDALIYFGYPQAHEDAAERAVRAGLALLASVAGLNVRDEHLRARIGVATGLVVVGELIKGDATPERTALGETPNLAARLLALAEPGTLVIAESTRHLLGSGFNYRELAPTMLKGFDAPVKAWEVTGEHAHAGRFNVHATTPAFDGVASAGVTPLVGRDQELALLQDYWDQATEAQGRVVLLTGDAGIGKSRLVQALLSRLEQQTHSLIEFRCSPYHANSPLYPVIALLPDILGWNRDDSTDSRLFKLQEFCATHKLHQDALPLLTFLLSLPTPERTPLPAMSAERQKQRTLQTLLDVILSFAAECPVLLIAEDLNWLDPTTMALFARLTDQVPTIRLLALFTARVQFQASWSPHSHVTPVMLTRLTRYQAEQMVQRMPGAAQLSPAVLKEIVVRTDGVPLFIEELTKTVLESGLVEGNALREASGAPQPFAIPATLQDSLAARLDRLTSAKGVAQLGATLGRDFSYAMLRTICDLDEETLQRELGRLVEAELLYQRGAPPEATYVFKHVLIQETAYQSLLRSTRQQYHNRIARTLVGPLVDEAKAHPEMVAMHYTEAGEGDPAVQWWQKAGQHAFRRASYAEAIAHYQKGLRVLQSLPVSSQRDQLELGLQVELGYALIPVRGWAAAETAKTFTRAGELCREIRDTPKMFRALWGLGAFYFVRGDQHQARTVADQCLSLVQNAHDLDAEVEAHYLSGIVSCAMGEFASGQIDLEQCIQLYGTEVREAHRILYGQDAKASALGWLAMALWVLGRPDEALSRAEEALSFVRHSEQPFLLARGWASVGFVRVYRQESQQAEDPLQRAIALCVEQGFTYFHAVVSAFRGINLVHHGNTDDGITAMQTHVEALRTIGSELLFTVILGNLAAAHLAANQIEQGLGVINDGLKCVKANGEHWAEAELHRVRGQLLLRGDSAKDAEKSFETAMSIARQQQAKSYELRAATDLALLWHQQGRGAAAKALLATAIGAWPETLETFDLRNARQLSRQLAGGAV